MSEWKEFSAKTVDEALNLALAELETTRENVEYEVIEKESSGILGLFSKPAIIRVCKKLTLEDIAIGFLSKISICSWVNWICRFAIFCTSFFLLNNLNFHCPLFRVQFIKLRLKAI